MSQIFYDTKHTVSEIKTFPTKPLCRFFNQTWKAKETLPEATLLSGNLCNAVVSFSSSKRWTMHL